MESKNKMGLTPKNARKQMLMLYKWDPNHAQMLKISKNIPAPGQARTADIRIAHPVYKYGALTDWATGAWPTKIAWSRADFSAFDFRWPIFCIWCQIFLAD